MPSWVWSNIVVVCLLLMAGGVTYAVRRSRMWSEITRDLWRRRRFALLVVGALLLGERRLWRRPLVPTRRLLLSPLLRHRCTLWCSLSAD